MRCTTNMDLIPVESHPKTKPVEEVVDEFVIEKVEDPNKNFKVYEEGRGWRSFRLNQLLKVNGAEV